MRSKAILSNLRISTKLLLLNLMIWAAFFLIAGVVAFSFTNVRNKLTEVTNRDMARAISNSQTARELSKVFTDIDLLSHIFYGKNDYLKSEGSKLVSSVNNISERTTDPDLKKSLISLHNYIESFLDQCVAVNTGLHAIESTVRETHAELTNLENLIAELLVNYTIEGEDTAFVEQLLTLVIGYHESLLQIGKLYAELGHEHYLIPLEGKTSPVIEVIDDLILRLQTITASIPDVARYGKRIVNNVQKYRETVLRFYEIMEKLGSRMTEINHSKSLLMSTMENIEEKIFSATQLVSKNIDKTIFSSGAAVLVVSIFVVALLGFATAYLVKSTINNPMQAILKSIESFGKGDFDKQIELSREDEWDTIEKGLNNMAADLLKSYTALRESEEKLRVIFDTIPDSIVMYDTRGYPQYLNPAFVQTFGWFLDELQGKHIPFVPDDQKGITGEKINEIYELGKPVRLESQRLNKEGQLLNVHISAAPIKNPTNEPVGMVVSLTDITNRKNLETQLQSAQRMESVGTLAGGIAHNFNNLLMGIMGNASLLLVDIDSEHPYYKSLRNIEKLIKNGSKLTSQLIGFARKGQYEVKSISLNKVVKETSDTFGLTRKEVVVHQELDAKLSGITADQGQIEQVLLNLCVNAADAMPGGGNLFLKTKNVTHKDMTGKPFDPKPGNYTLLTIRDDGTGMDKETMKRIFEPFFTTKDLAEGTGLGLASAYGIIKAHGGYIDVDSEKGHGTTFSIYLPSLAKAVKDEKGLPAKIVKGKETVLLVDDEEVVLDTGEQILKKLGYEVLSATNGREALELYEKNQDKIDMILLDMVMPIMGGGETYDKMREINSDIKVLLASGYSIEGEAKKILERGCDGFIQKPFGIEELSNGIRNILDKD
jgi:two-component system cell cycle sensor histidine kinase/response regulator CckA